ncbi:MAG: response regulator receiver protein [Thermoleophilia bacterium]|nr:response regulator receiver protein [Thermoleophilia bacterium]
MKPLADITILIAEDERPVRMLLRVVLEAAGARVIEAEHGAVALRLLDLHPEIDLLCTDVNMPILDGVGLVAATRQRRPQLPVIACTAMNVDDSYPTLAPMVDGVVQKPFVPSDLVRTIGAALARRDQIDAIAAS